MIRMLRVDMPGDALRDRIEANLAAQHQPELSAIHLVRGAHDLTSAMPRFVTAFIEAQFAPNPDVQVAGLERPARRGRKQCA